MDFKLLLYAFLMLFGTFISSLAQVMLKKSAISSEARGIKEYMNLRVIIAYGIFFGATLLGVVAYKVIPLSMGAILESTGYIYVTLFGAFFFNEKITKKKIIALITIIGGIVIYAV